MKSPDKQRITVFLPRADYLAVAATSKRQGKSMSTWVAELVREALANRKQRAVA